MIRFLLKRLMQACTVMFVISLIAFAIQDRMGDPVNQLVGQSVSMAERAALRDQLGLNDPLLERYGRYVLQAVQGDLGTSYFFKLPVTTVIFKKLEATLELVFGATIIILGLSFPLGIYAAIHPRKVFTKVIMAFSSIGISIPVFLTAILLIYVFSIELHWLPAYGRGEPGSFLGWHSSFYSVDGWKHLILPCISLASVMLPLFIRLIRSEMLEVLQAEYIRFGRAKGLSLRRIYYHHALKNTLLPVLTVGGVQIGTMVAYTILTETVFQWPGTGSLFLEAVHRVDTPLITGYLILVGLLFVTINTVVDLLYGWINPTISVSNLET